MAEGSLHVFKLGFVESKKRVAEAFHALDLSRITDLNPEEEAKGKEEGGEKAKEATEKTIDPEVIWDVIEEAVAKAIVDAEAIINMIVKAFKVMMTPAPEEPATNPTEQTL